MTMLSRILCVVGIVVLAYVIFSKPREILEQPAPQPEPQVTSQPPARTKLQTKPKPQPKPQPEAIIEPDANQPNQPAFRPLETPPQTPRVRDPDAYKWEKPFNTALMETDRSKLPERIGAAQAAINMRLQQLDARDSPEERRAIGNAQLGLNMLSAKVSNDVPPRR